MAPLILSLRLLMAIALYTFLAWALIIMWRDLKEQSIGLSQKQAPSIHLAWLGKDAREGEYFHQHEITIGRHPGNHWVLKDVTVSSRHARLFFHHEQWWLEDLDSKNSTFLNEDRISEAVVLSNEDEIRCGQVRFEFSLAVEHDLGGSDD